MTAVPDNGYCNVILVFHANEGQYGDVDLADLNVIMVARTTAPMGEGNWTAAVFLDERASTKQQESLGAIFGGAAGGPPSAIAPLIGQNLGAKLVPIEYRNEGKKRSARIGGILDGRFADLDLSGRSVALTLRYFDDEPGSPWQVMLYIDEGASQRRQEALAGIFLGRAGGTPLGNYAAAIGAVVAIRTAQIALDHSPHHHEIVITNVVTVRATQDVVSDELVSCGIPGMDHPGREVRAEVMRSDDPPFVWDMRGRCGFANEFRYTLEP